MDTAHDRLNHPLIIVEVPRVDESGLAGLMSLHEEFPAIRIVITSPHPLSAGMLLQAARHGACGYVPSDAPAEIIGEALLAIFADDASGANLRTELGTEPEHLGGATAGAAANAAIATAPSQRASFTAVPLTPRQLDVLALLARGLPNKMIGRELRLAPSTVKAHISAILRALQAHSRTEAVIAAIRHGLITPNVSDARTGRTPLNFGAGRAPLSRETGHASVIPTPVHKPSQPPLIRSNAPTRPVQLPCSRPIGRSLFQLGLAPSGLASSTVGDRAHQAGGNGRRNVMALAST